MARRRRSHYSGLTKAERARQAREVKRHLEREKLKNSFLAEGAALFKDLRRILADLEKSKKREKALMAKHRKANRIAEKKWKAHMKKIGIAIKKRDAEAAK